jgi:hypothetical protein
VYDATVVQSSSRRLAVGVVVVAVAAAGLLFVRAARRREGEVPEGAAGLVGCWKIASSKDLRYPAGESLCLHADRVVVLAPDGKVRDGWAVTWSRHGADWLLSVPADQTGGVPAEFLVNAADAGGLSFRSTGGWVDLTLRDRSALQSDDVLARLRACRRCVDQAIRSSPTVGQLVGSAPYSLRACSAMADTAGGSGCDFDTIDGARR